MISTFVSTLHAMFRGLKINCLATSRNVIFAQGAEQDLMGWLAYERTRHQTEGGLMPLLWVGRRDGGQASTSPGTDR